jgi:DnaD/phage-associated family protein
MTFTGFPARPQSTPIPNVFFTDLLPHLTDRDDLAVALAAFHALSRKRGFPRYIMELDVALQAPPNQKLRNELPSIDRGRPRLRPREQEVRNELLSAENAILPNNLRREPSSGGDADSSFRSIIERGLRRAVEIGMLLPLTVEREGQTIDLYFLNAPADRRGLEAVRSGAVDIGAIPREQPAPAARSSIFALYESLVGTISPLIADELAEAERLYPADWLEAAFREAASQNARSWRYVSRILERWAIEGPDHEKTERRAAEDRYFRGKYGKILKQRLKP